MQQYTPNEEHPAARQTGKKNSGWLWVLVGLGCVLLIVMGFLGALMFVKHDSNTSTSNISGSGPTCQGGQCMKPGGGQGSQPVGQPPTPVAGTVTTVSKESITIKLESGETKTYRINSNTQELTTNGPKSFDVNDAKVGTIVGVISEQNDGTANAIFPNWQPKNTL